jgi:predicted O-linked N-acetylglucosamine transferase (SPINDLY family)
VLRFSRAGGLPELIAETPRQYQSIALLLAHDPSRLRALKDRLATNRRTTPLFDAAGFTRNIENAYTRMMELFHQGESPRSFQIE